MKPLYYAVQAAEQFRGMVSRAKKNGIAKELEELFEFEERGTIPVLETSHHFILPDGGLYFDDKKHLLDLSDDVLHLPYQIVVLEYAFPREMHTLASDTSYSTKRVVILSEQTIPSTDGTIFKGIAANFVLWIDADRMWSMIPATIIIPRQERHTKETIEKYSTHIQGTVVPLIIVPFMKNVYAEKLKTHGGDDVALEGSIIRDTYDEIIALTHFLSVLSCSNVESVKVKPKKRPMGKLGKLKAAHWDRIEKNEYHVLQIKVGEDHSGSTKTEYQGVIRQHMRRGHIRRLPTGKRVWVTPCIVGNPELGVITKDYALVK